MKTVAVIGGQSIFDIAIQHCGSVDASYAIAKANGLTLDATLLPGQALLVPEVTDRRVVEELRRRGVDVASRWVEPVAPYYELRLPTSAEWNLEKESWSIFSASGAIASPLRLPLPGVRHNTILSPGIVAGYWSSTVNNNSANKLYIDSSFSYVTIEKRATGLSLRLILDGEFSLADYEESFQNKLIMIGGITYGFCFNPQTGLINPLNGRIWLDRNLGATKVAVSSTDADAYGFLYQWGRSTDGHQIRTSSTIVTLSSSDTPGHGDFITINASPYDWRSPKNDNLWQGVDGINNPANS